MNLKLAWGHLELTIIFYLNHYMVGVFIDVMNKDFTFLQQATMPTPQPPPQPVQSQASLHMNSALDKARRATELQADIAARLQRAGIGAMPVLGGAAQSNTAQAKPSEPMAASR